MRKRKEAYATFMKKEGRKEGLWYLWKKGSKEELRHLWKKRKECGIYETLKRMRIVRIWKKDCGFYEIYKENCYESDEKKEDLHLVSKLQFLEK